MTSETAFWVGLLTGLAVGALLSAWLTTEALARQRRREQVRHDGVVVDWPHLGGKRPPPPPRPAPTAELDGRGW